VRAAVLDHEQACNQTLRGGGDQDRVRLGRALHPRRDVRRVPEDVLHRPPTVRHDRRSRVQADPHLQRNDRLGGAPVEALHGLDNGQPGAHGPFGVVLVRLGHPKETHQAVAEELIDVAPQAGHGRGGRFLVRF